MSLLVVVVVVSFRVGSAGAQSDPVILAKAQALFDEGLALYNRGQFEDACPRFEDSLALVPGIGTRGKLAECYERLGQTASAWRLYREVELLARQIHDQQRADIAAERVRALEPRLARLVIEPGPSVVSAGFAVRVNSREIEPRALAAPNIVDPGTCIVVASAPGHQPWTTTVRVHEGQTMRVEVPALAPVQPGASEPSIPARRPRLHRSRTTAIAIVGVGALSLIGGGGYFGWRALGDWQSASGECAMDSRVCSPQGKALVDSAVHNANIANVFAGVGLAALAAGGVIWWRSSQGDDGEHPVVVPAAFGEQVGVMIWQRF